MSEAIKITATLDAYVTDVARLPDVREAISDPERHQWAVARMNFNDWDMSKMWTRVGSADITVTLSSKDEQVAAAIKSLNGQIEEARAKFLTFQADMLERISKLQALEYVEAE